MKRRGFIQALFGAPAAAVIVPSAFPKGLLKDEAPLEKLASFSVWSDWTGEFTTYRYDPLHGTLISQKNGGRK